MTHTHSTPTLRITAATRFRTRLLGLLALPRLGSAEALVLSPCASVHTWFMRYAIDVVYLDADDYVLKVVPALAPWRFSGCWRARTTLELIAGEAERLNLRPGAHIGWREPAPHGPRGLSLKK
jgi:hypothetical protein